MAVVVGDDVELRHWFEFDGANWRDASRTLTLTFVDAAVPAFRLVLAEGESERIALVVRERIEQSIVFQEHAELPSGRAARGMVRRDGEVLFTQVMIDGEPEAADEARLAELEASLRDVVGLDG
ncbi:MAG: hypothetical protein Q3979_06895 [Actinomycetaceae bacterium]|nr:hypothetical protein [Actinomycetaceae bacterium]